MKKILFILFTLLMPDSIFSQGNNLQFNQVINQDFSSTCNTAYTWSNAGTFTVSPNKVLKITSCSAFATDNNSLYNVGESSMKIGNKLVYHNNSNAPAGPEMPIWLDNGTYTVYLFGKSNNSASKYLKGSISAVEFNVVQ